jgi:chromosome segregation ATPase
MDINNNMNIGNIYNNNQNDDFINERKVNDEDDANIQEGNFDVYGYNNINDDLNNLNFQGEPEYENLEEQYNDINNDNLDDNNADNFNDINEIKDINDNDLINMNAMGNMRNINNFENIEDMNEIGNLKNMNNINPEYMGSDGQEEMDYQNNNSLTQQKLINNIEDINEHFIDLEQKFNSIEIENKNLKKELANEKKKNRNIPPNNFKIYENSINQGKILLEDVKKKNAKLQEKINDLESKNKSLNYQLIEANQKLKKYENDSKQNINDNKNENNGKNDKDNTNEITKLKNKIDEYEILISKMKFDKKSLEEKIENIIKEHKSEKNLMINYKNSEIKACNKLIEDYQIFIRDHNLSINRNNNMNINGNENVESQKLRMEISNKDKLINTLKNQINEISNDFNKINISQQNINASQMQIQKLVNEKKELIKENKNHKNRLSSFIEQINEANNLLNIKTSKYKKDLSNMKIKLDEYKYKIVILKKKICELHEIIGKMNSKSYQIVNNSLINNNIKNKMQIPSTPNQINKFSIKNNMNNTYLTQTPLIDAKNGNIIMNNNARQFGNSVGMNKNKSNDGLDQNQKKSLENYRKFLSQLDQNLPNPKP